MKQSEESLVIPSKENESTWQFKLSTLIELTGGVAAWLAMYDINSVGGRIIQGTLTVLFLFASWPTRRAMVFLLPAMYLPYAWLIWDWGDYPWDGYRWHWIERFWQLPGIFADLLVHPLEMRWFDIATTVATLAIILSVILLARISWWRTLVTSLAVLLASLINSSICLAIYRV